jgi:hypothetical protein
MSNLTALSWHIRESQIRLEAFLDFLKLHLDQQYPIDFCKGEYSLLKYYLQQLMYIINDVRFQRDMADYYGDKSC